MEVPPQERAEGARRSLLEAGELVVLDPRRADAGCRELSLERVRLLGSRPEGGYGAGQVELRASALERQQRKHVGCPWRARRRDAGIERVRRRGQFQIFSKVGQAYGFLIANAYVVDKVSGKSFFLVATIYANPDETMNDDHYGYDTVSFPALADVGEVFCRHAFGS